MFASVASQASTSANSAASSVVGMAAAQGRGQLADLLHEPHEGALDAAAGVLGAERERGSIAGIRRASLVVLLVLSLFERGHVLLQLLVVRLQLHCLLTELDRLGDVPVKKVA